MKRMTNFKARAMVPVLGVLLVSLTMASSLQGGPQGQGGGPRGGGPGGRQGGPGGPGGMRRGPQSIAALATRPDVARDLGLTQAQSEAIFSAMESARPARPAEDGQRPDREAMRTQMEARTKALDEKVASILSAAQFARLGEISIQTRGLSAALDPKVQTKLNLSTDQKEALAALAPPPPGGGRGPGGPPPNEGGPGGPPPGEGGRGRGPGGPGGAGGPGGRDGRRAEMEAKIAQILTQNQIARLKALGGKTFVADERGPGGPGSRGGPDGFIEEAFLQGLIG